MELTLSCIKYMSRVFAKYVYIQNIKEVHAHATLLPTPVDAIAISEAAAARL